MTRFGLICDNLWTFRNFPLDWATWDRFVTNFGYFGNAAVQSIEKPHEMAGNINYYYLRQQRDLYHIEYQQIQPQIERLGGRIAYMNAQLTGGANLVRLQRLLERRYYLLSRLQAVEPLLGLSVYAHVDVVNE